MIKRAACLLPTLCAVLFLVFATGIQSWAISPPNATKGVLDLSQWNWEKDGVADLNGEWAWYWEKLYKPQEFYEVKPPQVTSYVQVPGVWNSYVPGSPWLAGQGYATYRLKIIFPPTSKPLALKVLTASTALELYIDGQKMGQEGKVGTSAETMIPTYKPFQAIFMPASDTIDVVIQVSNFYYRKGGLWNVLKIGPADQIHELRIRNLTRDYFLAGCFLLIGLYHLFLYMFLRRNMVPLWFSLFSGLMMIRILTIGEYAINIWADWSWSTIIHVELSTFFLAPLILAIFSHYLFPQEISRRFVAWIVGVSLVFVALVVFTPPIVFTYAVRPVQVFIVISSAFAGAAYFKAWRNKRTGSTYFLVGFVVLMVVVLNDIMFTSFLVHTAHLFYLGLLVFVFSLALTLSRQYSMAFSHLEQANEALANANAQLTTQNQTIQHTNEQLTKLNAEMDGVVYRVSHDLRSPIASVLGLMGLARLEKRPEEIQAYMDMQEKTLRRMDLLIQDIIDYTQNNNTELKCESVNFHMLIEEIITDHSHLENADKITKTIDVNQPCVFYSDAKRLSMILMNLISNAIRYHNLHQEKPFIHVKVDVNPQTATIVINDNGQGISQEHLDKIFEMFYRANYATKGSGLGLYIVKEAVEKLGGTIKVESAIGEGTTFTIEIRSLK